MLMQVNNRHFPSPATTQWRHTHERQTGVIEDAKFKRREALADLAKTAAKK
jgi:hypothetical protein